MHTALMVILAIMSILIILSVLLQSSNSDGLSGSIAGGAEQLFGKKKSRGYDSMLKKATTVFSIIFLIVALIVITLY